MTMEPGINFGFSIVELIIPVMLLVFPIITLIDLGRKKLGGTALALWVLIMCAIPLLGALAYWIVRPVAESKA
jgi:cell division protein FtsX